MIDVYELLAVGIALFIGAIPIMKGWHKDPDFWVTYVDSRTELQKQDPKLTLELENWIKGGCRR